MGEPRNRVVRVKRHGEVDELEVVEAAMPTAGRGEARVRVLASGVEYTVAAGAMRPQISERISFDQVADAHPPRGRRSRWQARPMPRPSVATASHARQDAISL